MYKPPQPHSAHRYLADQLDPVRRVVGTDFGRGSVRRAYKAARELAHDSSWDVLVCEVFLREAYFLRRLDPQRRPQIAMVADDPLYYRFAPEQETSILKRALFRRELLRWNGFITLSLASELQLRLFVGDRMGLARWTAPIRASAKLNSTVGSQQGRVICVMNGGPDWRVHYKGLDLVARISKALPDPVTVVGSWDSETQRTFETDLNFAGRGEIEDALDGALCLLHTARRDVFPGTIVEAMMAGVPPIVSGSGSEWLVSAVDPRLVVSSWREALPRIDWLRNMPRAEYRDLGKRLRAQAEQYSTYAASSAAIDAVRALLAEVTLPH
jgi:glycosyltransferase involved in cell wall biosynthesis